MPTDNDAGVRKRLYHVTCKHCEIELQIEIVFDSLGMNRQPQYCPVCQEPVTHQ